MKTIVGFALLLCVATAVGKPARPQDQKCIDEAWSDFSFKDEACFNKILEIFQNPQQVNDSYFSSLCGSACGKEANDYFKEKCGVSLGEIFCSKDPRDQHYCFTYNKTVTTFKELNQTLHGPCANKDCSDPTCNAAIKNITCCVKEEKDIYLDIYGYFPVPLPSNCVFQEECTKTKRLDKTKILLQN